MKHMKKRVAALLLTLAMVLSLAPMAFAADEFPDMPAEDDPSYAAVKSAVDNAIMTGENGELNLEGTILRSTVAKMVVTAFAAKGEADLSGYPDVTDGAWYAEWMAKANQMGIMTGTSGKMNPGNEVTLAEVATMLVRALGLSVDKDATVEGVAAWAAPYVKALIDANYITAEDAAAAHEPMTRGNFAEVIYKVSGEGNYAKEENAEITEDVNGNIVITANGVSLKGITVKGDIIIADGVDAGSVVLDGVKVEGRIVVRGAGAELTNGTTASSTVVAATTGEATVKADDGSDAGDIAVAGTHGKAADKVTLDMAEPKATVTAATEVAVQNAEGGEITLQAANASLSVESGTVANVTVADGATGAKVDVAAGATIDKVTTNTDLAVTGEGTVSEKAGSGTVTDGSGSEVGGSDEPVDVPVVETPAAPVEELPDALKPTAAHNGHNFVIGQFDSKFHKYTCVDKTNAQDVVISAGCGEVKYEAHNFNIPVDEDGNDISAEAAAATPANVKGYRCECGEIKMNVPEPTLSDNTGAGACADGNHHWVKATGDGAYTAPGCETPGTQKWVCDKAVGVGTCTAKKTETLPATGHSLVVYKTVEATCSAAGGTYFKCSHAGCPTYDGTTVQKSVVNEIPQLAHTWTLKTEVTGADCQTHGNNVYECSVCKTTQTVNGSGPVGDHDFSDGYTVVGDVHTATCKTANCGVKDVINGHHMVTVTEGDDAAVAVTCTTDGQTAGKVCNIPGCDEAIDPITIPATGHTLDKGWTSSAAGHWHNCIVCKAFPANSAPSSDADKRATGFVAHAENATECKACGWVKPHTHTWNTTTNECTECHAKHAANEHVWVGTTGVCACGVEHTHGTDWGVGDATCTCGKVCNHGGGNTWGAGSNNGVCSTCGYHCTASHAAVSGGGTCATCGFTIPDSDNP